MSRLHSIMRALELLMAFVLIISSLFVDDYAQKAYYISLAILFYLE